MKTDTVLRRDASADSQPSQDTCDGCGLLLRRSWAFVFNSPTSHPRPGNPGPVGSITKCLGCALRHVPMLKRSLLAGAAVGALLTVLNQGDTLFSGQWQSALYWKIPLTFCVPFLVATFGALASNRR